MMKIKNDDVILFSKYVPVPNWRTYLNLFHRIENLYEQPWRDYEQMDYPLEKLNQIEKLFEDMKMRGHIRGEFMKLILDCIRQPIVDEITSNVKSYREKAMSARYAGLVKGPTMKGRKKERALGFLIFALTYDLKKFGPMKIRFKGGGRYALIQDFLEDNKISVSDRTVKHYSIGASPQIPFWVLYILLSIGPDFVDAIEPGYSKDGLLSDIFQYQDPAAASI